MGSITVLLTSCLTGLDQSVLQIKTKIVSCHTADSKPDKQEVNSTVILPHAQYLYTQCSHTEKRYAKRHYTQRHTNFSAAVVSTFPERTKHNIMALPDDDSSPLFLLHSRSFSSRTRLASNSSGSVNCLRPPLCFGPPRPQDYKKILRKLKLFTIFCTIYQGNSQIHRCNKISWNMDHG